MTHRILIIDQDQSSNEHLRGLLHPRYEVVVAPTLNEARALLSQHEISLVLGDFEFFKEWDPNFPFEIPLLRPKAKLALISRSDTDHYLPFLLEWHCFHVLPKLPFYNVSEVFLFLENILYPFRAFGLSRYLAGDAECRNLRIANRVDKNRTVAEIINFFAGCEYEIHELYDVRLIMEEGINNAIFHAFVDEEGKPKYRSEDFHSLDSSDEVWLEFGADATTVGFCITDNRGSLKPEEIVQKMSRQYNREGLYDESGRGLYLARLLSANMIFNIEKGKRTQVINLFHEKRLNIPHPFSINIIEQQ